MRRLLILIAIIIVLLGVGAVAYFYFSANSAGVVVAPPANDGLPLAGQTTPVSEEKTPSSSSVGNIPIIVTARLVKISPGPVVPGEAVIDIKAANASSSPEVAVSYIERQSGNVFSYNVGSAQSTRTSNRTIPGIQTASWLPDASVAFVRYLSDTGLSTIATYALRSDGSDGFFLPQNLAGVSVASTSVLTLASGANGSIASLTRTTDGASLSTVFTTPISALRASFAGKNRYLAFTKPSVAIPGNAFLVDSTGRFSRIAGPQSGLVALASPSGKWVLVSFMFDGVMRMELVDTATQETLPLPIATIADKCVWTLDDSALYCGVPRNPPLGFRYPDDWYQGAASFQDRLWKIQISGRYTQLVLDFSAETNGSSLDAQALALNPANTVLVFVNKNDGSLWAYKL